MTDSLNWFNIHIKYMRLLSSIVVDSANMMSHINESNWWNTACGTARVLSFFFIFAQKRRCQKKSILECPPNLNAPVPIIELISLFVKITAIVFIKYDYMNKSDYMILCTYLYIIIQRGFHGFELVVGEISRDEDSHNSKTWNVPVWYSATNIPSLWNSHYRWSG